MKRLVLTSLLASIILLSVIITLIPFSEAKEGAIPPTRAFQRIITSNDTVRAFNYSAFVDFIGLSGITITGSNNSKTVYFTATAGGGNMTVLPDAGDVAFTLPLMTGQVLGYNGTIWTNTANTGEANTASNSGTGLGLAQAKVGVDLPFKSLLAGNGISLTSLTNEVRINSTVTDTDTNTAQCVNVGSGIGTICAGNANATQVQLKTLRAGNNIALVNYGDNILINATSSGGNDNKTNIKEAGTQISTVGRIPNFVDPNDFLITNDVASDEIDIAINRNGAYGFPGLGSTGRLYKAQQNGTTVYNDQANTYSGSNAQAIGTSYFTFGADPADAGDLRLSNAGIMAWESSPASTDLTVTADASENWVWDTAWNQLNFNSNPIINAILGGIFDAAGNTIDNVATLISNAADPADAGAIQLGNAEIIGWEASPANTDITLTVDASENLVVGAGANNVDLGLNPMINSNFDVAGTGNKLTSTGIALGDILKSDGTDFKRFADGTAYQFLRTKASGSDLEYVTFRVDTTTCTGTNKFSAINNQTGVITCTVDATGSGAVSLGADVTCTATATYCVVFTIALTASSGNTIEGVLSADSNTAGAAVQVRGRADDTGALGWCNFVTPLTASTEALDYFVISTAPTDTSETVWLPAANTPQPIQFRCVVEADVSSPQNLIIEIQQEVASTGTIQKGSYYIKTP